MCGLFGELLCCVGLCEHLLCVGGGKWRVGVAMCQFLWFGQSLQLGLGYASGRRCSFGGYPCIGRIGILRFDNLCIRYA